MGVSATTRSLIVKALRVLLVFSLVFWTTFRIEMVAFAADENEPAAAEAPGEGGGDNTGDNTGDNPAGDAGGDTGDDAGGSGDSGGDAGGDTGGEPSGDAGGGSSDEPAAGESSGAAQPSTPDITYDRFAVYRFVENADTSKDKYAYIGAIVCDTKEDKQFDNNLSIETREGELKFVPVIFMSDGAKADLGDGVEWSVADEFVEVADFVEVIDPVTKEPKKTNVLKAKGKSDARIKATCKLKKETVEKYHLPADAKTELTFYIDVTKQQEGFVIERIVLFDENGNDLSKTETLNIPFDEAKGVSYQFAAKVSYRDASSTSEESDPPSFMTNDKNLNEDQKKLAASLKWSVDDPDLASIDDTGLFTTKNRMQTAVKCSTAEDGVIMGRVQVNTGIDNDLQGEFHPQDALHVVALPDALKSDAEAAEGGKSGASSSSSESVPKADEAVDATESSSASEEKDSTEGSSEAAAPTVMDKLFSLDDISAMNWKNVEQKLTGGKTSSSTTIIGEGPLVATLLEEAGVDLTKVKTLTFVDCNNTSHKLSWSDSLSSEGIMAVNSLVKAGEADGRVAKEEQAGQASDNTLLKNTRFRLLPGDGASLEEAYPWIKAIYVNDASPDGGGSGGKQKDTSLQPIIFYNPVPKGETAVLTVAVVGLYKNEQFGLEWFQSEDGGENWESIDWTAQTKDVPIDGSEGLMFKVLVTTSNDRENESEPVTIKPLDDKAFVASLIYYPPLAGEMAFFSTRVHGVTPDEISDYIWEWTEDGGETWKEIAGSRGNATFSAKTDPVEDKTDTADASSKASEEKSEGAEPEDGGETSDSAASPEKEVDKTPASSIWVRVRVQAKGGREAISNPVMLTVHVKEDPGAGQPPTEDIPEDLNDKPTAPGADDPSVPPVDSKDETGTSSEPAPAIQEVSSITVETAPRSQIDTSNVAPQTPATVQTPDGTEAAPTPESAVSDSPTDLIINPQVTAEILEQREAVNEVVQSTRPGARWTALTTVEPDGKDVQLILSDNPFAPFTLPFALGITAAGFIEKLVGFRRQTK